MSTKKDITSEKAEKANIETFKVERQEDLIYLGPTITGAAKHATVYKNGILPTQAKDCIKKLPMMGKLFVPLGKMQGAVKELKKEGSVLHAVYSETVKMFN